MSSEPDDYAEIDPDVDGHPGHSSTDWGFDPNEPEQREPGS